MSGTSLPISLTTTTLFIPNMHCPSCVENITQLLSPLTQISNLNVSLLLHTVTFTQNGSSPSSSKRDGSRSCEREVANLLKREGGFVVETRDDRVRSTSSFEGINRREGWFSLLKNRLTTSAKEVKERKREEIRRRIHWENCEACREGRAHDGTVERSEPTTRVVEEEGRVLKSILSVGGMTCSSCTQSLSAALRAHPDVLDVDINLLGSSATVRHLARFPVNEVKEIIDDAGFDGEVVSSVEEPSATPDEKTVDLVKTVLSIQGMTCASCSSAIDKALRGVHGINNINIDLLGNKGTITHMSALSAESVREMIEDIGYDVSVVSSTLLSDDHATAERSVRVMVQGIYCINCINKLNNHLQTLPFKSTRFSTDNHVTEIKYTPREPYTIRDILEELSNVSPEFEAKVVKQTSMSDRSRDIQKREMRLLLAHWIVAFIFAIPTFVIGILGMALIPSMDHFRMALMRPIWGAANLGTVILWPMATVVQFGVGRLFYERAFASLKPHLRRIIPGARSGKRMTRTSRKLTWRVFFNFGSMDLLVVLSTSVSYFASLAMLIIDVTSPSSLDSVGTYFDSCVFLIMFILLGRVLDAYARSRTTDAVALLGQLRPETALLVEDAAVEHDQTIFSGSSMMDKGTGDRDDLDGINGPSERSTRSIPVEHLEKGDLILIPPGSLPPTDGMIVSGQTTFDESSLTGESRPIKKSIGDEVFTGTTNLSGAVTFRITTTSGETMLEKIMRAVSEATGHKAPIEKLAETLTSVFVPIIVYLSIIILAIWMGLAATGRLTGHGDGKGGGEYFFAIEFAIATLAVACPCGIGLAVPCANAVGTGLVAKEGILATAGGEAFLGATKVGTIVFDKTGTLTIGKSTVTDREFFTSPSSSTSELKEEKINAMVREVERGSTHPLAQGIVAHLDQVLATSTVEVETVSSEEIAGKGLKARIQVGDSHYDILIGNKSLMVEHDIPISPSHLETMNTWSKQAKSIILVSTRPVSPKQPDSYTLSAIYALSDPPRETTQKAVEGLRKMGMTIKMLSGDNQFTAESIGIMVGIDPKDVIAGMTPMGKSDLIRSIQTSLTTPSSRSLFKSKRDKVMFVGDGLNDSIALSQSDVAVSMGHGSQVTMAGSDFVLLSSNLISLPILLASSRKIVKRQKLNLVWACIFNLVCLPLAAGVFYPLGGVRLTPVWSAVIMACSSLSVVCSSLALKWGI